MPERSSSAWRRGGGNASSASLSGALPSSSGSSQQQYSSKSDKTGLAKKSNSTSQLSATGQSEPPTGSDPVQEYCQLRCQRHLSSSSGSRWHRC